MSSYSAYFVPGHKFAVGQFKPKVRRTLEQLDIIDGNYYGEEECYASSGRVPFEYASIHDTDKERLIPEAASTGYGSTCPECGAEMDGVFFDLLDGFYDKETEANSELDMKDLQLKCESCNAVFFMREMKFRQDTTISNQYFQLVGIDTDISPSLVRKMETLLGCSLNLIYEPI